MSVTLDAGVITQAAIDAVAKEGFLFTVDPASKTASTIGGERCGKLRRSVRLRIRDDAGQPAFVAHGDADRRDHQH